jgi:NADPH-dependent 2,4-dienoyl-CoA reductase/sulfur reductase-like enzyme/peroxiredoxin family protein/rhodanese-related sulfurtransferase/TusA-related sulfurtransferase
VKIIVVGGVAGGASAAARARRLDENADIIIYERGEYISFANCGLPYHVGKVIQERDALLLLTPESFRNRVGVDVKTFHEVIGIDRKKKVVKINDIKNGKTFEDSYDKLILSPGSSPLRPPIPGSDDSDVLVLWTMNDMDRINALIESGIKSAIVIGGGFIGVEVAENLAHRKIKTALVEMLPHIMPQMDQEMTVPLHDEMEQNGVKLFLKNGVSKIERTGRSHDGAHHTKGFVVELQDSTKLEADMVIMAIGVRPNNELAKECDLEIGESGGIKVNKSLQTSDPDIYAVGDAVEITNLVTGTPARIPLAGPANRQGRMAANNIFGAKEEYKGTLGTAICKIFDVGAASTGMSERMLKKLDIKYNRLYINPSSHASYYPGAEVMNIKVLFDDDGKILGAQIVGRDGIDKRIDILATAMRMGIKIQDLEELELAYAPPFGSAKDAVNFVGFVGNNMLKGDTKVVYPDDLPENYLILDVRSEDEYMCGSVDNSINIPLDQLRGRLKEVPKDKHIAVLCRTGVRSYNAERILRSSGYNVSNLAGGYIAWLLFHPEKGSVLNENSCWTTSAMMVKENPEMKDVLGADKGADENVDVDVKLNACGLQCPGPIVAVKNKIADMKDGQVLKVTASDSGFMKDLPSWCSSTGNTLISIGKSDEGVTAIVKKGLAGGAGVPAAVNAQKPAVIKQTTIVLFSNDLDKTMAAFILATGFSSLGHDVTIFFTFWGLNVLRKDRPPRVKKDFLSKMFGMMMPCGAKKLALSKMHMMGMGTAMMKHVMNSKNVDSLPTLIKQAQEMDVKFVACEMAMNVMGISQEEMLDGVDTAGVANFAALAEQSGTTLFI